MGIGALDANRLLGTLAQTMGNLVRPTAQFGHTLAFCGKVGYRPELAWTCYDYADLLLERANEGDRAKAMALLDEALAVSWACGL